MTNPELEKKDYQGETGFISEKQLDVAIEIGIFKSKSKKKKIKKILLFEKKSGK